MRTGVLSFVVLAVLVHATCALPVGKEAGTRVPKKIISPPSSPKRDVEAKAAASGSTKKVAEADIIKAIIMPHSHDDVGWLNTISVYYDTKVKFIYDTVVASLYADQTKYFQSVEMAYFSRWWQDATDTQKQQARTIIERKQFIFVIGGWTMQDEACSFYVDDINQMTEGHRFIANTFGEEYLPRFSFQVDPFGASSWTAAMYKKTGFDAHLISRVNYTMKADRQNSQTLQFVWNSQPSLGSDGYIWTHMMDQYSYTSPGHYMFDTGDPAVAIWNIESLASFLVENIKERAAWFKNGPVLWPFGTDFQWTNATVMFENMDKLIKHINDRKDTYGVEVNYGTLNQYFESQYTLNQTWPSYEGDFFPYNDEINSYWTGYFTSRPYSKGYFRASTNVLRQAETLDQLSSLYSPGQGSVNPADRFDRLQAMRNFSGDATHHDAVPGTSNTWVVQMYINNLTTGAQDVAPVITDSLQVILASGSSSTPELSLDTTALSQLQAGQVVPVVVYNSLPYPDGRFIAIQSNISATGTYVVTNSSGAVESELLPTPPPQAQNSSHTLWFLAYTPPLGYSTYYIALDQSAPKSTVTPQQRTPSMGPTTISNDVYTVTFNANGVLSNITDKRTGVTKQLSQQLLSYASYDGVGTDSGAYVFRPNGPATNIATGAVQVTVTQGKYISEVYQVFATNYTQVVRLYNGLGSPDISTKVEFTHHVGPLVPNTEIVSRFESGLNSGDVFYTDANGVTIHKRKVLQGLDQPIAGNYFPMVMTSYIQDTSADLQLTLLSERAHGFTSLRSGEMEVMLHRRTAQSDGKGPALPDSDALYHVQFNLILGKIEESNRRRHRTAYALNFPPLLAYSSSPVSSTSAWSSYKTSFTGLKQAFPENLFLTSYRKTNNTSPLSIVRVNHLYQTGEDSALSAPVTVDLSQFLAAGAISNTEERTLTTGWSASRFSQQWSWKSNLPQTPAKKDVFRGGEEAFSVTVQPTDVRTFYAQISASSQKSSGRSAVKVKAH